MATELRSRTISGISWSALSQVVTQIFTFAISLVVARILGPKAYGLIGMIVVFTGFANIFGDLGLGAAIIQRKQLEPRHLNTAFWINVIMGLSITVLFVSVAPLVAAFYKEPALAALTAVIALRFLIDSLSMVPIALMNREIHFHKLAKIQISATVVAGLIGLGLALYGAGPWSLVAQSVGNSTVALLLSWRLGNWRPRFSCEFQAFKELFGFSGYVLGFNIANYWARSLDQLLIGRFVGAAALGVYSRAYGLMLMPLTQVSSVVGRVMMPALATIQEDKPRVKRAYLKAIGITGLITFPMMTGLFAVSSDFVLAILGNSWAEAIPILQLFCWVGMMQSIATTTGWIYLSQGKSALYFITGIIFCSIYIVAFAIGIQWGIWGVVWSYFIANLVELYPLWAVTGGIIGLTALEMARTLSPPFLCAVSMGAAVCGLDWLLPGGLAHWQSLAIEVPLGVAMYLTLISVFQLNAWRSAREAFADVILSRLKPLQALLVRLHLRKSNS